MLRCEDNSIYTGITTDINRRMNEHFLKSEKCAKYTLHHSAKKLESVWKSESRKLACKLEYHIKKLSKKQKEELIIKNNLEELLGEKINYKSYTKI
jgi:putative endonuclease